MAGIKSVVRAIGAGMVVPLRLVLRCIVIVVTTLMLGFARGLGGGPRRIEDPDRPNQVVQMHRKK
jgi:hypothetical protein